MPNKQNDIKTLPVSGCYFCGAEGTRLYEGIPDRLFGAPGSWGHRVCPTCRLLWMDPMPAPEDLHKAYKIYFTKNAKRLRKGKTERILDSLSSLILSTGPGYGGGLQCGTVAHMAGKLMHGIPMARDIADAHILGLTGTKRGRLLDVGCGNGSFLSRMRGFNWEAEGVELDPEAADIARKRGFKVSTGTLEQAAFPDNTFDAITMMHVIEHVYDPTAVVRECVRVLRPGGRLSMITPNRDALWHRVFGRGWYQLDPPRHLFIFTGENLKKIVTQASHGSMETVSCKSLSVYAARVGLVSRAFRMYGKQRKPFSMLNVPEGVFYYLAENFLRTFVTNCGEDILLIGRKI